MVLAAIRTIVLNPAPGASVQSGVSYSGWLIGSVVPMWITIRVVVASWRAMWRVGRRRRSAARPLAPAAA